MDVEVVPLTEFVHGYIVAHEGVPQTMPEHIARDLEKAGLVRIKMSPARSPSPPAGEGRGEGGKVSDDGAGQPSSALPAAPASPRTMLHSSRGGATRPRKSDTQ